MHKSNLKNLQQKLDSIRKKIDISSTSIEINVIIEKFVCSILDSEFCSLWFYDKEKSILLRNREKSYKREMSIGVKKGIIYKCFMNKKASIYNYLASDKDYVASIDNPDAIKIKSKIIVPLINSNTLVGIITAYSSIKKIKKYTRNDQKILEELSPFFISVLYKMHSSKIKTTNSNIEKVAIKLEQHISKEDTTDQTLFTMANFIHDIRTPANTLQGFLELLETQIDDKRLKGYLLNAKESASFINKLTTSMLEHVKFRQEYKTAKINTLDSMKFFTNIANSFIPNMSAKNISYNIFIDPLLPKFVLINDIMMQRVLINLLSNAYKFTPVDKKIDFLVKYDSITKKVFISIKDEGIGIEKDKQKEIFKAFKQIENASLLNYKGTGLGLAICSKYVSDLGGELKIDSELEKGATFYFEILLKSKDKEPSFRPIQNSSIRVAILTKIKNNFSAINMVRYMIRMGVDKKNISIITKTKDISPNLTNLIVYQDMIDDKVKKTMLRTKVLIVEEKLFETNKNKFLQAYDTVYQYGNLVYKIYKFINIKKIPRVLIAEDDKISILLIKKILEGEYCEIDTSDNGKNALEMLINSHKEQNPYSVVYIDNRMPLMNGEEVIKSLREFEEENNSNPIYVVSISGDTLNTLSKSSKNFNQCVCKPFKADEIRKVLSY